MRRDCLGRVIGRFNTVGEIVGYPNAANFSTRFKAWSGMTPRQFKQSAQ